MQLVRQLAFPGAMAGLGALVSLFMVVTSYNVHGYLLVALALSIPILFFIIPRTVSGEDKFLIHWLFLAVALKAGASAFRMIWGYIVKDGRIDSGGYDQAGRVLAEAVWNGHIGAVVPYLTTKGTMFIEGVTGVLYSIVGPTVFGGFLFFAMLVFVASCIHYRAFRIAFPQGNRLLFFGLIFFYPSWLYWPSSIGKDAFIAFGISLVVYGLAIFLRRSDLRGLVFIAIGVFGVYMVRPHVAALLTVGLAVAFMFRPYKLGLLAPMVRIMVIAAIVFLAMNFIGNVASFVRLDEVSLDAALDQYETFQDNAKGGAAFTPVSIFHPIGVPHAIMTVLYRPFPWEAHRGAALALAAESSFLLALTIVRFSSIRAAIASVRSNPFLLFIFAYVLVSILVFTSFGNFSIVGRQRLQFLPLFFMLLAYPVAVRGKKAATSEAPIPGDRALAYPQEVGPQTAAGVRHGG